MAQNSLLYADVPIHCDLCVKRTMKPAYTFLCYNKQTQPRPLTPDGMKVYEGIC